MTEIKNNKPQPVTERRIVFDERSFTAPPPPKPTKPAQPQPTTPKK